LILALLGLSEAMLLIINAVETVRPQGAQKSLASVVWTTGAAFGPPFHIAPDLGIVCEPCGRAGRYNVARLIAHHGDARLPALLAELAALSRRFRDPTLQSLVSVR
jgi:hypothetical protein